MRRGDRGAASVEFALVVPIFLVLVSVAGYFAWQLYTESQLERAAQRAARYAAVPATDGTYGFAHCSVVQVVDDQLAGLSVDATGVSARDASTTLPSTACPNGATASRPDGYVRVRVTHVLDNPFSDLLTLVMRRASPLTITGSGEARVEDPT